MSPLRIVKIFATGLALSAPGTAWAQSPAAPQDSVLISPADAPAGLPVLATLGIGFGRRRDACSTCPSPDDTDSFTGHLSLAKKLGRGVGIGTDVSVWRRGRPGPVGSPDSTGVPTPTTLTNMLGNASVVLSWQVWHVWVRAGGGMAWAGQDMVEDAGAEPFILRASGKGLGYTAGAGFSVPLSSMVSLAFFGNYNAGTYDLATPLDVVERGAKHAYVELGVGLSLR